MAENMLQKLADGMIRQGNIDLDRRPIVRNPDGSISTISSASANIDGVEWLFPTITPDGLRMTLPQALEYFKRTGQHLGAFASPEFADAYAKALSARQGGAYNALIGPGQLPK